jgi:hypothetical protein
MIDINLLSVNIQVDFLFRYVTPPILGCPQFVNNFSALNGGQVT